MQMNVLRQNDHLFELPIFKKNFHTQMTRIKHCPQFIVLKYQTNQTIQLDNTADKL